jgi:cytochrome c553
MGTRRWMTKLVMPSALLGGIALTGLTGCGASAGSGEARAAVVYEDNCGPCHGAAGQGSADPALGAPAIAALPEWYVKRQLGYFIDGVRGAHPDDVEGLKMRPMSRTLLKHLEDPAADRADVDAVAAYVAKLPVQPPERTVHGDVEAGKATFATCSACHGADGKGNEQLGAPPIAQMDDWYLAKQLGKFKAGMRGVDPRDTTGKTMRPMALALKDDKAVADVVAYIGTLSQGGQ